MVKKININFLVDETGYKNNRSLYICKDCKRKANLVQIKEEEWFYRINCTEDSLIYLKKDGIGYIDEEKVDFVCKEHYERLKPEVKNNYVKIGLPYFLSVIGKQGGVFSF